MLTAALPVITATGLVTLTPAAAQAAPALGFAYVWAHSPTTASYTPTATYSRNSTGGTNTINRVGVGAYVVHLPGLGRIGGTVHATSYGFTANSCQVGQWFPAGPADNLDVHVRCFTPAGGAADTPFTLTFLNTSGPGATLAYAWANQASSASYTPSTSYQFNSGGGAITATRSGVGQYQLRIPNLAGANGHVQVTAYGFAAARCKVVSWGPSGVSEVVNVRCFSPSGALRDTLFTATYARGTGILRTTPAAYAWSDQPLTPVYIPSLPYQFNSVGGTNTIRKLGVGSYRVETFGQPLQNGDVQVTAYGTGNQHCNVTGWSPTSGISVRCYTPVGGLVDTPFTVSFVR